MKIVVAKDMLSHAVQTQGGWLGSWRHFEAQQQIYVFQLAVKEQELGFFTKVVEKALH